MVVVRKKDSTYRMCMDYREVNRCTIDLKYPMQQTAVVLERMAGMRVFATLDLKSGVHQMPLADNFRALTAFAIPDGLFEFCRVPFGLKNAPPYFQRAMATVLQGLVGVACEAFVDDIMVYAADVEGFLRNLRSVLGRLRAHGRRLKRTKCRIGFPQVAAVQNLECVFDILITKSQRQHF